MLMWSRHRAAAWGVVAMVVIAGSLGTQRAFGQLMPTAFELNVQGQASLSFGVPDGAVGTGQQFDVDVVVSDVENLGAFDMTMTFDNTKLEYLGVTTGEFITSTGRTATCIQPAAGENGETREEIANLYGALHFGCTTLGLTGSGEGPSGEGVLATLSFGATAAGDAALGFAGIDDAYVIGNPATPADAGFTDLASVESCDGGGACSDIAIAFTAADSAVTVVADTTSAPTVTATATPVLTTPTPASGFFLAVDCDASTIGVQSRCDYPAGTSAVTVGVVLINIDQPTTQLGGWSFDLVTDEQAVFDPVSAPDISSTFEPAGWNCNLVPPARDVNPDEDVADSFAFCVVGIAPTSDVSIAAGETLLLGTVQYSSASPMFARLRIENGLVGTASQDALIDACTMPSGGTPCVGAVVLVGSPPDAATATATPTATITLTPTPTRTVTTQQTPEGPGVGAVTAMLGLNQVHCLTAPANVVTTVFSCSALTWQSSMQALVACLRGTDTNGDGRSDECVDEPVDVDPADFAFDRDANQVFASQYMFAMAFVDGDYPVLFETDAGVFIDQSDAVLGETFLCFTEFEPDCDANESTAGDGVVVARIRINGAVPRGTYEVRATQNGVTKSFEMRVVGPPFAIGVEAVGPTTIETGASSCAYSGDPASIEGDAAKTLAIARTLDSDGTRVASAFVDWEWPFDVMNDTQSFEGVSEIAGAAAGNTISVDLGGELGIGAAMVICGKTTPGEITHRVRYTPGLSGQLANYEAEGSIGLTVVDELPTATATATATSTPTPTPTASATATDTPTAGISATAAASGTAAATVTGVVSATSTSVPTATVTNVPAATATTGVVASATATASSAPTSTSTSTTATGTPSSTPVTATRTSTGGGGSSTRTPTVAASSTAAARSATASVVATTTQVSVVLGGASTPRTGVVLPDTGGGAGGGGGGTVGVGSVMAMAGGVLLAMAGGLVVRRRVA